jgi:hypothetical protein
MTPSLLNYSPLSPIPGTSYCTKQIELSPALLFWVNASLVHRQLARISSVGLKPLISTVVASLYCQETEIGVNHARMGESGPLAAWDN